MKSLVLSAFILLIAGTASAGDFTEAAGKLQCPTSFKSWKDELGKLKADAADFAKALSSEHAEAKIELKERDIILVTLLWPNQLEGVLKYSAMYKDCADVHWKLLGDPSKPRLLEWKSCVEHGYGRDSVPEAVTFLLSCYQKLLP